MIRTARTTTLPRTPPVIDPALSFDDDFWRLDPLDGDLRDVASGGVSAESPIGGGGENTPGTSGVVGAGGDMAAAGGDGLLPDGGDDFPPDEGEDLESGGGEESLFGGGDDGGGEDGGGDFDGGGEDGGGDELSPEEGGGELLLLLLPEGAESGDEAICKKCETQFRPSIRLWHRPEINLTRSPLTTRHFDSAPLYIKMSNCIST